MSMGIIGEKLEQNLHRKQYQNYDKLLIKIAGNIKKYRKQNNLTQENMTNYGFSYKHYQRIESGKYSMNLYTLYRLTKAFNINVKNLVDS